MFGLLALLALSATPQEVVGELEIGKGDPYSVPVELRLAAVPVAVTAIGKLTTNVLGLEKLTQLLEVTRNKPSTEVSRLKAMLAAEVGRKRLRTVDPTCREPDGPPFSIVNGCFLRAHFLIVALGTFGSTGAVAIQGVEDAIAKAPRELKEPGQRALAQLGAPSAVRCIEQGLASALVDDRRNALADARELPDLGPSIERRVRGLMENGTEDERLWAAIALAAQDDLSAMDWLLRELAVVVDRQRRDLLIFGLRQMGPPGKAAIPALTRLMNSTWSERVIAGCAAAIEAISDAPVIPPLPVCGQRPTDDWKLTVGGRQIPMTPTREGRVTFDHGSSTIIGTSRGEWGGEVHRVSADGTSSPLASGSISPRLMLAVGKTILLIEDSSLWRLNAGSEPWTLDKRTELPGRSLAYAVDGDRLIVATTPEDVGPPVRSQCAIRTVVFGADGVLKPL